MDPFNFEPIDFDKVQEEIASGYISEKPHPEAPLKILNYTQNTQIDWRWTNETMQCRGLIVDEHYNIIKRPFPKFFNADQINYNVPNEPFEAYEKLDGSLGILYHVADKPYIATRGSFTSDIALEATKIYRAKYGHVETREDYTYLFEIIFPSNRIVINYGDLSDLILIAVIDTKTGKDVDLPDIGLPLVKKYEGFQKFEELTKQQDDKREGFVVKFSSGKRVKIKFEEYKRLHRILTGVNSKAIWEVLMNNGDLSGFLDRVPDEFFNWVRDTEKRFRDEFKRIEDIARSEMTFGGTPKEIAERYLKCQYPGVMFWMLKNKDYSKMIWKMIKPKAEKPFKTNIDL